MAAELAHKKALSEKNVDAFFECPEKKGPVTISRKEYKMGGTPDRKMKQPTLFGTTCPFGKREAISSGGSEKVLDHPGERGLCEESGDG